jgi:hypothetical protein
LKEEYFELIDDQLNITSKLTNLDISLNHEDFLEMMRILFNNILYDDKCEHFINNV